MSAVLAVDVGSVRLGLAISAAPGLPALPLATIIHSSRQDDIDRILHYAQERGVDRIIVGYPLRLDGTPGPAAQQVDRFIAALRRAFGGEVIPHDERLTTAAAARKLRAVAVSGSKKRRYIDQLAAVEILASFLAQERGR